MDDTGENVFVAPSNPLAELANTRETAPIPCLSLVTEAEREANGGYAPQGVPTGAPAPRRFVPRQPH